MAYKALIQYLETLIAENNLRDGVRLPAERQLAARFEVSRQGVREVLQGFKAKGLIESRRGGGHYVSMTTSDDLASPLLAILANNPEAHFDFLEFRHSVEGDCAYNAALRATDADLKLLKDAFVQLQKAKLSDDLDQEAEADSRFHTAIAEASHNLLYLHVIKSFRDALQANMLSSITQIYANDMTREALLNQHAAIYDAIINRQPSTAKDAMQQHIRYLQQLLSDFEREQARRERQLRRQQLKP